MISLLLIFSLLFNNFIPTEENDFKTDLATMYTISDANAYHSSTYTSGVLNKLDIGTKVYVLSEYTEHDRFLYETTVGFIESRNLTSNPLEIFYPVDETKYADDGTKSYYDYELVSEYKDYAVNSKLHLIGKNDNDVYKTEDGYYVDSAYLMDERKYIAPPIVEKPATTSEKVPQEIFAQNYSNGSVLTKQSGVNYYNGRRETYYSSRVLYHYRTPEWWLDGEGFYRTAEGYYVVAASDMAQGTVFNCSKGACQVLDSGCAAGTTDYYVQW